MKIRTYTLGAETADSFTAEQHQSQNQRAAEARAAGLKLITDDEIASLKMADTASKWDAACDRIKGSRAGRYPEDWFLKVVMSGLMNDVSSRWQ